MDNQGKITVFMSLVLMVMLSLVVAAFQIVDIYCARIRTAAAVTNGVGSVRASYNTYIFEKYHILLIDKQFGKMGEGYIEEIIDSCMNENLGEDYSVSTELCEVFGVLSDDISGFKKQVEDDMKYAACEDISEEILSKTGGSDEPVSEKTIKRMDEEVSEEEKKESENSEAREEENNTGEGQESQVDVEDPREELKKQKKLGIAFSIKPASIKFSDYKVDKSKTSESLIKEAEKNLDTDSEFVKYGSLKSDVKKGNGFLSGVKNEAAGVYFAKNYFNNALTKKNETSKLNLEMEYIIAGKMTDEENYKKTVNEIITLRLGVNFAYLLTDEKRLQVINGIAAGLAASTPVPYSVIKYLLTGCWAYIEGIAETYYLIRGYKLPYVKDSENWLTDFDSLTKLDKLSPKKDDKGMDYENYLEILIAIKGKRSYYRMLDLISINSGVDLENLITGFYVNITVDYKDTSFKVGRQVTY